MKTLLISVSNENEFNEVGSLASQMGYIMGLDWNDINCVKVLFLEPLNPATGQSHVGWSHREIENYSRRKGHKEISIEELRTMVSPKT